MQIYDPEVIQATGSLEISASRTTSSYKKALEIDPSDQHAEKIELILAHWNA